MLVKAFLTAIKKPELKVPFQFNPKELSIEKINQFAEVNIPGLSSPVYQFVRGNARSVTMDLLFDTYEERKDVRIFTDRITGWDAGSMYGKMSGNAKGLMDIDADLHAPPVCLFIWGKYIFMCIIERVSKKFTMFLPEGIPVRATLNVTLKEYRDIEIQVKELALQSSDLTKRWVVTEGDSLWAIAAKEYGNPGDWRLLAEKNNIDNPRMLMPGHELVIPKKE